MTLRIRIIGFFSLVLLSTLGIEASAQNAGNTQSPANIGDRDYPVDTVFSSKRIREDDKMFKIDVWRRIDLREKYNLPFYGSGDSKNDGIVSNIYKAVVEENALEIFADEDFTQPMTISEFQTNFWIAANGDSIFEKNLYYIDFMEDLAFDKHRSEVIFDIKYIELVMPSATNSNRSEERRVGKECKTRWLT